jgi:maltose alpha-D-glucosyltransferase/alpha-amylase
VKPHSLWHKDAVVYEMHVKAFRDSDRDGYGDFRGLTDKLDYLERLGINCVWLLPFYPSPLRDDGYDISMYEGIHENYGGLRDFRRFVRAAHSRGIRVITELVLNHTSDQHPWFQAARRAPRGSSKWNFYVWSDNDQKYRDARIIFVDTENSNWTWDPEAKAYYWHRFFHHQPDLNFDNPAVVRAMIKVMRFWLDAGVDGLRLDAVPYLVEREGTDSENLPETHAILRQLRAELDNQYEDRVFLAEANQWPADVRPYFGNGDECHIAYHFPVMPRIFMALRQEDRHPISEILEHTPEIPDNCQWALFLRNHDELTLEMVTDDERDYMYDEYAKDPRMRLNMGIRRRLMPLLGGSRRQYELVHSLLTSLKGTPVIYYGDEIGMGDNIYLGDRDGVRTPMQWTGDRNGGFSEADSARLYSPPISDPVYGYQAINVEAQERLRSSPLAWMQSILRVRKQSRAFGRGSLRILKPHNRKVFAYLREYEDDTLLIVNNLSRQAQAVEIDLREFAGRTPVELFGNSTFPRLGELPYLLTLGPYGFYWFRLVRQAEHARLDSKPMSPQVERVPVSVQAQPGDVLDEKTLRHIEETTLVRYLLKQPWFDAGRNSLQAARCTDVVPLASSAACVRVEAQFRSGASTSYMLPLMLCTASTNETSPRGILAHVATPAGEAMLVDAMHVSSFHEVILQSLHDVHATPHESARLTWLTADDVAADIPARADAKVLPAEDTNTSVVFDSRLLVKLYRRVEPGEHPEWEVMRALGRTAFGANLASPSGCWRLENSDKRAWEIGLARQFIAGARDGRVIAREKLDALLRTPAGLSGQMTFERTATELGLFTRRMHEALVHGFADTPWAARAAGRADLDAWGKRARRAVTQVLDELHATLDDGALPAAFYRDARALVGRRTKITDRIEHLLSTCGQRLGLCLRIHGRYRLQEVLWRHEGAPIVVDFEGDPSLSLDDRRQPTSPIRDVASMLRSIASVSGAALSAARDREARGAARARTLQWERKARTAFLRAYMGERMAGSTPMLPARRDTISKLLTLFEIETVFQELHYELRNRPEWAGIPLARIRHLLDQ